MSCVYSALRYETFSDSITEMYELNLYTQDKHYKSIEETKELSQYCLNLLKTQMDEYKTVVLFTVQHFNSIATLRFCLSKFSDILCEWCESGKMPFPEEWLKVLEGVKELLSYNSPRSKYPAEYFIKYTVRQHGIQLFNELKKRSDPSFKWIIPEHLNDKNECVSKLHNSMQ